MKLLLAVLILAISGAQATEWAKVNPVWKTRPTINQPKNVNRIIGGDYAFLGQFKHQVALFLDSSSFCGGSLISATVVLTAAHCVDEIRTFEVHAGTTYYSSGDVVTSRLAVMHEFYDSDLVKNDIAIIILPQQLYGEFIFPIRLPSRSMVSENFVGQYARVSGWGRTSDDSTAISENLLFVDVKVITNEDCAFIYGDDIINDSKICVDTNFGFSGTCNGDSGGPLIIFEHDGDATLIGIVSFGASDGCEAGFPDGLTRVTEYLDWLEENAGAMIRP